MITPVASGFVSFYRSAKKYEAIYLYVEDAPSYLGMSTVEGQTVFEFTASDAIRRAVETFAKNPDKALVPVVKYEEAAEALGLLANGNGNGPVHGKRGAGAPAAKRNRLSDAALKEFALLLKKGASKPTILAMLAERHGLAGVSNPAYYSWKKRAEALG